MKAKKLPLLSLVLAVTILVTAAVAKQPYPQVHLGYATYEGTTLENAMPLHHWGRIAFRGAVCYGVDGLPFGSAPVELSEDCLFIDVFVPSPPPETNSSSKESRTLPVMVWFQGGAFVQLFNPNYNGTGLVEASNHDVIIVSFNYRVGSYGFLANEELRKEGNLNVGLHDQRFALSWVHKHIHVFGGDPDRVTLFGTSVGAGSVLLQSLAYGGNTPEGDTAYWNAGIATAVYMPAVSKVSDHEFEYEALAAATNCTDLRCLRTLSSQAIQAANVAKPFPGQSQTALFPYGPVIDNDLFSNHPQSMLRVGNFSRNRPLIIGSSHSEGTVFVPEANTIADINTFLTQQFPKLTQADLDRAHALYKDVPEHIPGVTPPKSPVFFRAAQMYGDVAFACPALQFTIELSKSNVEVYYLRNNIIDPVEFAAGYLVPHTWEVQAVWGPEYATNYVALLGASSYEVGGTNRNAVSEVQRLWTRFAARNGHFGRENLLVGSRVWEKFGIRKRRLRLQANATVMEHVLQTEIDRCAFWAGISSRTLL